MKKIYITALDTKTDVMYSREFFNEKTLKKSFGKTLGFIVAVAFYEESNNPEGYKYPIKSKSCLERMGWEFYITGEECELSDSIRI